MKRDEPMPEHSTLGSPRDGHVGRIAGCDDQRILLS
jgi:hypothetical protein